MRQKMQIIFLFVGMLLLCSGCKNPANQESGRYVDGLQTWKLVTSEGVEFKLELPEGVEYPQFYYGIDCFYMCGGQVIYQMHKSN